MKNLTILQLLMVFLGGGIGSLTRYLVNLLMVTKFTTIFPLGTFTVNLIGCFLIGIIAGIVEKYSFHPHFALLLTTGFCGGFTTFSSFALDNNLLIKNSDYLIAFIYTSMSILWGFGLTFLGIYLVKRF